jgi:hypothetical protein
VDFLNKVLSFQEPSKITENHLLLCSNIFDNRIVMPLPLPHTENVLPFTKFAGTEHYDSNIILAGCYIIRSSNLVYSVATELRNECYVGQSTHLGHRVKSHAKKVDFTTRLFIESLKNQGIVELCIVPEDMIIPNGLSRKQFITLLEQYLIIRLGPAVNKKLLATPGII